MNLQRLIWQLTSGPDVVDLLCGHLDPESALRRGPQDQWSILEIVNHLADEEVEDFRTRTRLLLESPESPWPPIDPQAAIVDRGYNKRDLATSLSNFRTARRESVNWLSSLRSPDWFSHRDHPRAGRLHAGDVLAAWVAHDLLHIRQLAKRRYELLAIDADPFGCGYAGDPPQ